MDHPITSVCGGIRPSRGAAMNSIVIVSDTFRYDYLGANGNAWIKTPELDALARQAVCFDRYTISSFPTTSERGSDRLQFHRAYGDLKSRPFIALKSLALKVNR